MDKLMKLIGWGAVGVVGGKLINDLVHGLIYTPGEGINTAKALVSAVLGTAFTAYCVYRAFNGFKNEKK